MLNSVGYIGYGIVGKACEYVFKDNSESIIIDPLYSDYTMGDFELWKPRLTFVSLPAPTMPDGSVDASIIYNVFAQLSAMKYDGIVVLKSTLPPAIVYDLYEKYGSEPALNKVGTLRYVYSPEFIREKHWKTDAVTPYQIILACAYEDFVSVRNYYKCHSIILSTKYVHTDYISAAMVKYAINSFLAMKVVFMNQLESVYREQGASYGHDWVGFADTIVNDKRIGDTHIDVPGTDDMYGYGGSCFPKDMHAMIAFDPNERLTLIRETILANTKIRLTGNGNS